MRKSQQSTFSAVLATALGAATAVAVLLDGNGPIPSAQAQTAEEKKRREERERAAPARPPQPPPRITQPPPSPPPRPPQVERRAPPPEPSAKSFQGRELPPPRPAQQFQQPPATRPLPPAKPADAAPPELRKKEGIQRFEPPPAAKPLPPAKPADAAPPELRKKEGIQRFEQAPGRPGVRPPGTFDGAPPPTARPPSGPGPEKPAIVTPTPRPGAPGLEPKRFDELRKFRIERVEEGGRRKVIQEPGRRFIVKEHNRTIVRHDETERFLRRPGAQSDRRPDGTVETFYVRRDGVRIVTVVDANGRLLRRYRRHRDGREYHIIDNRRFYRNLALGVGLGIVVLNLPPLRVTIPREDYIVDYDRASDDDLYETLDAPPLEDLGRAYSLEEIRDNYDLLARVRSVDIDTINFESGSWEVPPEQYDRLERIARAIVRVLDRNPDAVFMIAGHTDAVGSDDENASLSDRRAAAVAEVLTDQFNVPAENLVTQGYGEQYLKIDTPSPEPRNRRVSVHNVTGLMAER